MTSRRKASAGILGSAIVALAVLTMGSGSQPNFGDPLEGRTSDLRARFKTGKAVFERDFDPREGLGPVFNNSSCANCHDQGGIGGGSDTMETRYGQVIDGVFNSLTQFDGQWLHAQMPVDDRAKSTY
jgi:Di-haem oxidoreductase, putative peroxidase